MSSSCNLVVMLHLSCLSFLPCRCRGFFFSCVIPQKLFCFLCVTHFCLHVVSSEERGRKSVIDVGGTPRCTANLILNTSQTMSLKWNLLCHMVGGVITLVITVGQVCFEEVTGRRFKGKRDCGKLPSWDLTQSLSSSSFKASHLLLTCAPYGFQTFTSSPFSSRLPPLYCHALSTCHTFDHLTDGRIKDGGGR